MQYDVAILYFRKNSKNQMWVQKTNTSTLYNDNKGQKTFCLTRERICYTTLWGFYTHTHTHTHTHTQLFNQSNVDNITFFLNAFGIDIPQNVIENKKFKK
jgi:hypothetical protein